MVRNMSLDVIFYDEYWVKCFNILKINICVRSILNFDVIYIFGSFVIIKFLCIERFLRIVKIWIVLDIYVSV